jgi:hypothetical protein
MWRCMNNVRAIRSLARVALPRIPRQDEPQVPIRGNGSRGNSEVPNPGAMLHT